MWCGKPYTKASYNYFYFFILFYLYITNIIRLLLLLLLLDYYYFRKTQSETKSKYSNNFEQTWLRNKHK